MSRISEKEKKYALPRFRQERVGKRNCPDYDKVLFNISFDVNKACDNWERKRGVTPPPYNFRFGNGQVK
jgi:hypothetical protein